MSAGEIAGDRRALALMPTEPSTLERLGRICSDPRWLLRAVAVAPDFVGALINAAAAATAQGALGPATRHLKRALALDPSNDAAWFNRAVAARSREDAAGAYVRTLALDPFALDAATNLALLAAARAPGQAERPLKRGILVLPAVAPALSALALLSQSGGDNEAASRWFARAEALAPDDARLASNRLFHQGYDWDASLADLFHAHARWAKRHAPPASHRDREIDPDPDRRLRIGYVSPDLVRHPVGFFLLPVLENRDPAALECICYSGRGESDAVSQRLKAASDDWVETALLDDAALEARIRADRIDILVDLSGHTGAHRLLVFAAKPAPLQVTWMGYPATTGLPQIDYLIADASQVRPEDERWYAERILRIEPGYVAYAPPEDAPAVSRLPARANGHVTFGSLNNLAKLNPGVFRLWARVLDAVKGARLLLAWQSLGDPTTEARVRAMATASGIAAERLVLRSGGAPAEFLGHYGEIDIALDPFPYSGGLTTIEALWMGVPVVTWPGERFAGRHAASHLHQAGLDDWIAPSPEAYVARAAEAASDLDALALLRKSLRPRLLASPLLDGAGFAEKLEALYRRLWQAWVARTRKGLR